MGRDRQLPAVLGQVHAGTGVPRPALLVATAVSLAVALVLRDRIDLLVSLISFGALTGFALLHVSVLMHFSRHVQRRRLFAHVVSPVLGIAVVAALIWSMQPAALAFGSCWLATGLVFGALLHVRGRAALKAG